MFNEVSQVIQNSADDQNQLRRFSTEQFQGSNNSRSRLSMPYKQTRVRD